MNDELLVIFLLVMRRVDQVKRVTHHQYYYESSTVVADMIEVFHGTAALDIARNTTSNREPWPGMWISDCYWLATGAMHAFALPKKKNI